MNKQDRVDELLALDSAGHLRYLHDLLLDFGFTTRMPSNSKTLLFEALDARGKKHGLAAMRSGYVNVLSFPKTYWSPRKRELENALKEIGPRHFIETQRAVSESQYSACQVRVSAETVSVLERAVGGLLVLHSAALRQSA